jgi:hypothetical protein
MERHLCENSTEYAHLYAIRDKLMGSGHLGAHRNLEQKVCSVPERSHDYFVASGLFCTVVHSSLDARPDMAGIFVVLFAPSLPRHSWALLPAYR